MTEAEEIKAIETELRTQGVTAVAFRKLAQVSGTTWHRIKNKAVIPNGATMNRIRAARAGLNEK